MKKDENKTKTNNEQEELVVELPEESKDEIKVEVAESDPVQAGPSEADLALKHLKEQLEAANRARAEAEYRAQESERQAQKADMNTQQANLYTISSAIDAQKREVEIQKATLAAALSNGDHQQAAEIQYAMSETSSRLQQLQLGKEALEKEIKNPPQKQYQAPVDPVEQFASQLSPRSAAWVRSHPQCVTDPRLQQKMIAAHNIAVADGIPADSDEYFQFVEDTLKISPRQQEAQESAMSAASAPVQRRTAPPAAPVSRSGTGTGRQTARLTKEEAEMAKMMGQTPEEYAKHKLELIAAGRITH
jgi:hypothetical protein